MIDPANYKSALRALNLVLVCARQMAYEHANWNDLVTVLDIAEYLPRLLADRTDRTADFRASLVELASRFEFFNLAVSRFDAPAEDW